MTPGAAAFSVREAAAVALQQARREHRRAVAALPETLRLAAAERRFEEAHAAAVEVCEHPESYRVDCTWEHDNGYGRQTMVTGSRCNLCGAKQSWKGSSGWSRREEHA